MNTGPLRRALIAPRRYSRADLHCLQTVDYPAAAMTYATVGSKLASNRRTRVRENRRSDDVRFPVSDDTVAEGAQST
jgi:hypothetical protein